MITWKNPEEHPVMCVYRRIDKMLVTDRKSRNETERKSPKNLMLSGKVKAYTDCLCLIKSKYPECFK